MEKGKVRESAYGNGWNNIKGGRPARKDLRREKREKFLDDRRNWE